MKHSRNLVGFLSRETIGVVWFLIMKLILMRSITRMSVCSLVSAQWITEKNIAFTGGLIMPATRSFRSNGSNNLSSIFLWFSVLLISLGMLPHLIPYYFQLKYWVYKNDSGSSQTNPQKAQRLLGRWLNRSFFSCSPDLDLLEMN